jgi:hypothetical protein
MRPVLDGEARAILSPEHLVVSMRALAFEQSLIDGALFERIRSAVCPRVVLQGVHVLPEQLSWVLVPEHLGCGPRAERSGPDRIGDKDRLGSGIHDQLDERIALVERRLLRAMGVGGDGALCSCLQAVRHLSDRAIHRGVGSVGMNRDSTRSA